LIKDTLDHAKEFIKGKKDENETSKNVNEKTPSKKR